MAMKYQKGTVYPQGTKVKMWYGKYLIYGKDKDGKEVKKHRNVPICPKANTPKWKAEQLLREMILKESNGSAVASTLTMDDSVTFRWFVEERYIPMRQGKWSPAYRETNTYQLKHYLISQFGDQPLKALNTWDSGLVERYGREGIFGISRSLLFHECTSNHSHGQEAEVPGR